MKLLKLSTLAEELPAFSPVEIKGLLTSIKNNYSISEDAEITLEANPDDITTKN